MPVPLFASSLTPYGDTLAARLAEVAASGKYILGPEVSAFEEEFASYLGVRHVIGVGNGTDALTIALRAVGVKPGDEVVVPSLTFYATAEAAVNAGATPVFCDVDADTMCVTQATVEAAMTERTAAVVPVDLFGHPAPALDVDVPVVEDAAQAAGAALDGRRAGALGTAATFSFFPSKNLPCLGDGGAIATDDDDVAELARRLRFHGSTDKQTHTEVGYNSRLDSLQAAVLRVLLPELDGWTEARNRVATAYAASEAGRHVKLPGAAPGATHAWHLYVAQSDRADELAAGLAEAGIGARAYYRTPVHRQPAMAEFSRGVELPVTDELARTILALPMGKDLTADQVAEVARAIVRVSC